MADFAEVRDDASRFASISNAEIEARHFQVNGELPSESLAIHRDLLEEVEVHETSQGFVFYFSNPDTGCSGRVELDIVLDDYGDRPEWVPRHYPVVDHNQDGCHCRWFTFTDDTLGYLDEDQTGNNADVVHVFPWNLQAFARSKVDEGVLEQHYEALLICKLYLRMWVPDELRYPEDLEEYYNMYGEAVSMTGVGKNPYPWIPR